MDSKSESVKQIVSKAARNLGYRKHLNSNWSKDYPDVIHVIGLQKSRWGLQYYLEAAIWLKIFGPAESPKFYECHVQLRLDSDISFEVGDVDSALNQEDYWRMDPEERLRIISTTLKRAEAEFFGKAKTLEGLRDLILNRPKFTLAINKCVKEFFNTTLCLNG
jgi:hypothetical protein